MKDDWSRSDMPEEYSSGLHQRTEELYRVPDSEPDPDGLIECSVFVMRDMIVFPRMISPIFVEPGANLLAIQEAQIDETTMIALIQQDAEIDEPGPEDFLPIGVEIAVGRLLSLADGNSSALVQGRRRVELVEFTQTTPYYRARVRPYMNRLRWTATSTRSCAPRATCSSAACSSTARCPMRRTCSR